MKLIRWAEIVVNFFVFGFLEGRMKGWILGLFWLTCLGSDFDVYVDLWVLLGHSALFFRSPFFCFGLFFSVKLARLSGLFD